MRARSGKTVLRKRARMRKATKGYRASRGNLWRQMETTLVRAGVYAYRDRRQRRRNIRSLWITRINAACRARGLQYNVFIAGLLRSGCELDRKMLSEVAIHDPATFDQIAALAKEHAPKQPPPKPAAARAPAKPALAKAGK
jgi:large subunit ribosomal protein L20